MSVSFWTRTSRIPTPSPVPDLPAEVEVCIVGGGIVGLTAANELAERGHDVLVVDADVVGRGVTGQSTAKVTVATGLRIDQVTDRHGVEVAREFVDAGRAGMDWVLRRLHSPNGLLGESASHDLCATTADGVEGLKSHAALAQLLGLETETHRGGAIPGSLHTVRYPGQWMLQPTDYLRELAARLVDIGGRVATGVTVKSIEGGLRSLVETDHGPVSAAHVIAATHVPLGRIPSMLPWRQVRHHAVVFESDQEISMALDVDGGWSIRPVPGRQGLGIALGSDHVVGEGDSAAAGALHRWTTTVLDARIVDQWSSQDVFVDDHLPIVGRLGGLDRVLTATGFGGWGLALGTAAGIDLAQRVSSGTERWSFWTLTPSRLAKLAPAAAAQGAKDASSLVADNVRQALSRNDADALSPGQGVVVQEDHQFVARSCDTDGVEHAVSARCTHMGCIVAWNNEAQSWDCPCHGSRFAPSGEVLHGPAVDALHPVRGDA